MIEFDWDEANINHIALHDVLPHEAEEAVSNQPLELGTSIDKGEFRISQIGATYAGRLLIVVITPRQAKLRVVTSYPAPRRLRRLYFDQKGNLPDESL